MKIRGREYIVAVAKKNAGGYDLTKYDFTVVKNGFNYWVADPFPIEHNGELYIFGEVFEYSKLKGSIGYTKLQNGIFTPWKIVIEEPYHMSFPNIFKLGSTYYMCPEANESKEIYFYRCVSFPDKWIKDVVIASDGNYSDTIFYSDDSGDYGFTCVWKSVNDHELKFFKLENSKCIFSDGDIRTLDFYLTRPAGKVFFNNDKHNYLMVSQICKPLYGSGLIFKEFSINWPDYNEKELARYFPDDVKIDKKRKYVGMHTFNSTDNYVVIDLVWDRFSFLEKASRLIHKIERVLLR